MGFAPMDSGFADRRVSYFTTWPCFHIVMFLAFLSTVLIKLLLIYK